MIGDASGFALPKISKETANGKWRLGTAPWKINSAISDHEIKLYDLIFPINYSFDGSELRRSPVEGTVVYPMNYEGLCIP